MAPQLLWKFCVSRFIDFLDIASDTLHMSHLQNNTGVKLGIQMYETCTYQECFCLFGCDLCRILMTSKLI